MTSGRRRQHRRARQRGQATVEVALALPLVVFVLLAVIQVALVARSQILVTHAAREAARQMAVDPDQAKAVTVARATPGLEPGRVLVQVGPRGPVGSTVAVTVTYRAPTDVPLVGALFGEPDLGATVSMRVETGPDGGEAGPIPDLRPCLARRHLMVDRHTWCSSGSNGS